MIHVYSGQLFLNVNSLIYLLIYGVLMTVMIISGRLAGIVRYLLPKLTYKDTGDDKSRINLCGIFLFMPRLFCD